MSTLRLVSSDGLLMLNAMTFVLCRFNHPSTYKHTPVIWIPKDDLGLSAHLIDELNSAGVYASDVGAFIDLKGYVDVTRNPPDQEWIGGDDK